MIQATLRKFLPKSTSLRGRAATGVIWSVMEHGLNNVLRLASNLIMTRLLVPEAFGLMAMVLTLQVGLTLLTEISIHRSVVQSKTGDTPLFLRVAWTVQVIRGVGISAITLLAAALLWLLAPVLAPPGSIYGDPALPGLIALSSISMICRGLESTNQLLALRRLHLGRVVVLNLSTQVVSLVTMVGFGLIHATVWTLLLGYLVGSVFRAVLSQFLFEGPRMALAWDKAIGAELWNYGRWLVLSSSIAFVAGFSDRIILGGLLDARTFSQYSIAMVWVEAMVGLATVLIDRVGFSTLAETMRESRERIGSVTSKVGLYIDVLVTGLFLSGIVAIPIVIYVLYSSEYHMAASFIPLLAVGVLCTRFNLAFMLVLSDGDSRTTVWASVLTAVFVLVALPTGYYLLGVAGALAAVSLKGLAAAPLLIVRKRQITHSSTSIDLVWLLLIIGLAAVLCAAYSA
jgi:O-antigen/teichoic acid export membrane protein